MHSFAQRRSSQQDHKFLRSKIQFFLRFTVLNLVLLFIFRMAFFLFFHDRTLPLPSDELLYSFYLGLKFDIRLTFVILTPPLLLSWLGPLALGKHGFGKALWKIYFLFLFALVSFFYFLDYGHYAYLKSRVNASALNLIENPLISLQMVWETYPVMMIFFGGILLVAIYYFLLNRLAFSAFNSPTRILSSKVRFAQWFLFILLWAGGLYGKFSYYPLRWSESYFSPNSFISSLSANPILFFFETLTFRKEGHSLPLVQKYYADVAKYLGVREEDLNSERPYFGRKNWPQAQVEGTPNIVVIVLESMAAYKSGLFGNPLNPTPYLDELSKESQTFTRFYVPTQATARSIFAAVTGIPDLSRAKSNSRNPLIVNQHSIINELTGYEKFYFLGGSANWGNIRSLFSHNIKDIKIFEEGDFSSPRSDVWGISDYHLFIEANSVLKRQTRPFFAFIQSASFHRPYTIPQDKGSFKVETLQGREDQLGQYGFESLEEYNSLRFQDFSLGHFFHLAKKEKYYENTIFFILGDHGLPVNNAANVPLGERIHDLENFHVPFLIHGPKFFPPGTNDKFVSELDLFPTVAGILGKPYYNNSLGRDIFDSHHDQHKGVFTYYWYMNPPTYGFLDDRFYFIGNTDGRGQLYEYGSERPQEDVGTQYPEELEKRRRLAHGLYESAKYLRFHNPQKPLSSAPDSDVAQNPGQGKTFPANSANPLGQR